MKKYVYVGITSLFFIARLFLFISIQDVGVEHDGGWYLGMARNVAERGIYASYVNTVATSDKPGSFPSIHGRFSAQDKNGFVYFPAGVTVGPTYIFPESLFLKLFGYGWVQYRLWPFIAFCLLIPLLFYVVLQIGSAFALLFFQAWLWFYPQILLNQSYEALSEHIALLFLLLGFIFLQKVFLGPKKIFYLGLSGLFLGLSIQTKNVYALGVIFSVAAVLYSSKNIWKSDRLKHILLFMFFLALPTLLFELYRFIILFSQFGLMGYWQNNIDIKRTWESGGSGTIILRTGINPRFVYNKLAVWKHLGVDPFVFVLPLILASPFFKKKNSFLFWNIFFSTIIFFTWFGLLSSTGWFRHIFPAILMGMILISTTLGSLFDAVVKTKKGVVFLLFCLFLSHVLIGIFSNNLAIPSFDISKDRIIRLFQTPYPNKMQGPLSHPIFSRKSQDEVSYFIKNKIHSSKKICFYEWALVAELPVLVDRVFFPYPRCGVKDILIVGPYQKGIYALKHTNLPYIQKNLCKKVLFGNDMYTLCTLGTF